MRESTSCTARHRQFRAATLRDGLALVATLEGPVRSKQTSVWIVLWTTGGQPVDGCSQGSRHWGQPVDNQWSDRSNRSSVAVHKLWKKLCATPSACREKHPLRRVATTLHVRF